MHNNKIVDVIGTLLLIIGMFLAFLPHAFHVKAGLDEGTSHLKHVVTGLILIVVGLGFLIYNNESLKIGNRKI